MQLQWVSDTHTQLFSFTDRLVPVLQKPAKLVPDPATEHCGRRCNRKTGSSEYTGGGGGYDRYACILIKVRMHANSDYRNVTRMPVL